MRTLFLFAFFPWVLFAQDVEETPTDIDFQKEYDLYALEQLQAEPAKAKTMTGSWNGSRTYLEERGFTVLASYITDMLGNPCGGKARGFGYTGSFGLAVDLDFDRALRKKTGLEFYCSATWRTGTNLSNKIGNQFNVSQLYGTQTVLLSELYFKETLYDGALILKAGRLCIGNDFIASPLYGLFVNNAFDGNPVGVFYNFPSFTAYPNATWGSCLTVQPLKQFAIKIAVYNANSDALDTGYHGVNFTFSSTNGVIWISEWAGIVNSDELPGNYRIGALYQTGAAIDFERGPRNGNYSWYLLCDQMIYNKGGRKLTPFVALLFAPEDRNTFPIFLTTGLVGNGLFKSRPNDTTSFGVAYGQYSKHLPQTAEIVLELNHWFQINDWLTIAPDLQYIINPKGLGTIHNALVIGFQAGFIL